MLLCLHEAFFQGAIFCRAKAAIMPTAAKSQQRYFDVRFTPESRHVQCTSSCPLWANAAGDSCSLDAMSALPPEAGHVQRN